MHLPISSIRFPWVTLLPITAIWGQTVWQSELVYYDDDDHLVYQSDSLENRIPDFGYTGYRNSQVSIPEVPVVKTISPVTGDNTVHIQNALFEVALMPKDSTGFHGALLLEAGLYEIRSTLEIKLDGIVLRGVGAGENPETNTILLATGDGPHQRPVLVAGGGGTTRWSDMVAGTRTNIVSDTVLIGERSFEVEDASRFLVGDNIIIYHPCTAAWLAAIDYGGTHSQDPGADPDVDVPWSVGSQPIVFNRYIRAIEATRITIDVPVYNHLIRDLSQAYIYRYARSGLITNVGVENIRIDIETAHPTDENHAWNAFDLFQIEDAWVRNCTTLHFGHSGFRTNTATRVTIENCAALEPVSEIAGERRYNFNVYTASQQVLFKNCRATNGRHHYVSNGMSWTSGVVFLDCTSSGAYASSEGHRRWSMGLLYDNLVELDGPRPDCNPCLLGLYNRGYYGTSHGWGAAHCVAWNCDVAAGNLIVQQPPTAQNYAIGCHGAEIIGKLPEASFEEPEGYIEGTYCGNLYPRSLFRAQLQERLAESASIYQPAATGVVNTFELYRNYPNPFNNATCITYSLLLSSKVELTIYDVLGKEVAVLTRKRQSPGIHTVTWNGRDRNGNSAPNGLCLLALKVDAAVQSRKIMLLK